MFHVCNESDDFVDEHLSEYVDDLSGASLDPRLVIKARREEIDTFKAHGVYKKVPIQECIDATGKKPIGSRWIDINKGDDGESGVQKQTCRERTKEKV